MLRRLTLLACPLALAGCSTVVMDPAGDVARSQARLIWASTGLMLLIILPVIVLTLVFAWRYRASNKQATYRPDWDHSIGLELVIWAAPLLIVVALGALTWVGTHTLDPYRPLTRIAPGRPATAKPLEVDVVALDWKWLFIYPEQGIATVNRLVVPVDRPVQFRMTSSTVMNTLWVPSMAGMIYAMPGMETQLHAVLNKPGRYEGRSANYSGAGFSGMTFWTDAVSPARFDQWAAGVRGNGRRLDDRSYNALMRPSEDVAPFEIGAIDRTTFARAVQMCTRPGTTCMAAMPAMDGKHPPAINDRPQAPGEMPGAVTRDPRTLTPAPGKDVPAGQAPGATRPGSPANRNLTMARGPAAAAA